MDTKTPTITVAEAARQLGCKDETVRVGIINGTLPIGSAVKCKLRYIYIIPRERFEVWINGKDLFHIVKVIQNDIGEKKDDAV